MDSNKKSAAPYGPAVVVEAAEKGDIAQVMAILKKYPDKVEITSKGCTAMQMAAQNGHGDVVRCLKQRGADVNYAGVDKNTPLHHAVCGNHPDMVRLLLDMNAEMNIVNAEGKTPQQLAHSKRYKECTREFSDNGVSSNGYAKKDETKQKLLCAAQFKEKSCVVNGCIHGCEAEACVTFEPCSCKVSCFMCSMKYESCKKCGRKIEKITYTSTSTPMKEVIRDIDRWKKENEKLKKSKECSICQEKEYDCVLLDCHHTYCSTCADKIKPKKCPACRKTFTEYKKIYFS